MRPAALLLFGFSVAACGGAGATTAAPVQAAALPKGARVEIDFIAVA